MLTNHMVLLGACWRNHPCIESLHAVFGGLYSCQILRNGGGKQKHIQHTCSTQTRPGPYILVHSGILSI